jgi:hypothetical protein
VSLTNNQLQSELDARRAKNSWIGEDDGKVMFVQKAKDQNGKYALEPMRIRTFVFEYKPSQVQPALSVATQAEAKSGEESAETTQE